MAGPGRGVPGGSGAVAGDGAGLADVRVPPGELRAGRVAVIADKRRGRPADLGSSAVCGFCTGCSRSVNVLALTRTTATGHDSGAAHPPVSPFGPRTANGLSYEWIDPDKDVWNSVAVSFYEHLWDDPSLDDAVAPWINDRIFADYWGLWELVLPPGRLATVAKKLGRKPPVRR